MQHKTPVVRWTNHWFSIHEVGSSHHRSRMKSKSQPSYQIVEIASIFVSIYTSYIYIYTRMYAPHIYRYKDINIHTYHICAYIKDTDIYIQYVDPLTSGFPYPLACDMSHQGLAWGECLHGLLEWLRRFGSDCLEEWVPKMEESWHTPYPRLKKVRINSSILDNFPETKNKSVWTIKGWFRWCIFFLDALFFVCLFGFVEGWCEDDFGRFSHIWGAWDNQKHVRCMQTMFEKIEPQLFLEQFGANQFNL